MDFDLSDDLLAVQDVARRFAADYIAPNARRWDREADFPRELIAKLAELGFLGILIPSEYGGCGLGDLGAAVIMEEIARQCGASPAEFSLAVLELDLTGRIALLPGGMIASADPSA